VGVIRSTTNSCREGGEHPGEEGADLPWSAEDPDRYQLVDPVLRQYAPSVGVARRDRVKVPRAISSLIWALYVVSAQWLPWR